MEDKPDKPKKKPGILFCSECGKHFDEKTFVADQAIKEDGYDCPDCEKKLVAITTGCWHCVVCTSDRSISDLRIKTNDAGNTSLACYQCNCGVTLIR